GAVVDRGLRWQRYRDSLRPHHPCTRRRGVVVRWELATCRRSTVDRSDRYVSPSSDWGATTSGFVWTPTRPPWWCMPRWTTGSTSSTPPTVTEAPRARRFSARRLAS